MTGIEHLLDELDRLDISTGDRAVTWLTFYAVARSAGADHDESVRRAVDMFRVVADKHPSSGLVVAVLAGLTG